MGDFLVENGVLKKYTGTGGDIIVPDGVTTIGTEVFYNRDDIKSIVVPQGVTYIEYGAFSYCRNLEKVVLPEGMVDIHNCIFSHCTSLVEVVLPDSLETLGISMFSHCTSLKHVKLPKNVKYMSKTFINCDSLETVQIPDSVTTMKDSPFWQCKSLKEIVFGKNTPDINFRAEFMSGCKQMEKMVVPENNEHFTMRDGVVFTKDGKEIVYCLPTLSGEYIIPDGVEIIRQAAFQDCEKITNVVIPNSVREIQSQAFARCRSITTLVVPDSVEEIGDWAFDRDLLSGFDGPEPEPYKSISFGTSSGKTIAKDIFDFPYGNTPLVYPELPLSVVGNKNIKLRLAIGFCLNSALYKGEYAKGYQKYAKSQKKNILEYAKKVNQSGVEEYYKKLEETEGDTGKKKIEPEPTPKIDFGECTPMEEFECNGDVLVKYLGSANRVVVPQNIKHIQPDAFLKNNTIEEIVLLGVEGSLLERTFSECKKLKRVILSAGINQIEKKCFITCPKLQRVTILSSEMKFNQDLFKAKAKLEVVAPEMSPASFKVINRPQVIKSFAVAYVEGTIYKPSADSKMIAYLKRQSHQMYQMFEEVPELFNVMMDYSLLSIQDAQTLYAQYEKVSSPLASLLQNYIDSKGKKKGDVQPKKKVSVAEIKRDWVYETYSYIDESTGAKTKAIKITKYKGYVTDVVIPESIGGITVNRIDIGAFNGNKSITSVVIPESITSVGGAAFGCCPKLQRVEIKGKNVSLGSVCFGSCTSLSEFIADYDTLSWGPHMFQQCYKLTSSDGFVILGPEGKKRLVDVHLPVNSYEVRIPDGVTIVNDYAFSEYDGGNIGDGCYVEKIRKVVLPETVEIIGRDAFAKCVNLREINIPASVQVIMTDAFVECNRLRQIAIPESVRELQPRIFGYYLEYDINVVGQKGGKVEQYVEKYSEDCLYDIGGKVNFFSNEDLPYVDEALKDFDISRGTLIKYWGYQFKVKIPECVTRIGLKAFYEKKLLKEVTVTGNTKTIEPFAFAYVENLNELVLEEGVEMISASAFSHIGATELTIPGTVKEIGEGAFSTCKSMKKVVIKQGVEKIDKYAFYLCNELETVEIPDSVVEIGKAAFYGCDKLKNIDLPEHITNVDEFFKRPKG